MKETTAHFTGEDALALFEMSLDATIEAVRGAVQQKYPSSETEMGAWCKEVFKDKVIVENEGKMMSMPWTMGDDGVELGEAAEVEVDYKPVKFSAEVELIERDAKLFEAGEYPDKSLTITEDDLDLMAANHPADGVPVKIEHVDTAFDGALGKVKSIYRKGKELLGKIEFPKPAWDFISAVGAKKLSCGVKRDKSGIGEVSIVMDPRIADATIFRDTETCYIFSADVDPDWLGPSGNAADAIKSPDIVLNSNQAPEAPAKEVKTTMPEEKTITFEEALRIVQQHVKTDKAAEAMFNAQMENVAFVEKSQQLVIETARNQEQLNTLLRKSTADNLIAKFKREGKMTPAVESIARAILAVKPLVPELADPAQTVKFTNSDGKDETIHLADLFVRYLEALPPVISFAEIAKQEERKEAKLSGNEAQFISDKMGLDPDKVAANL